MSRSAENNLTPRVAPFKVTQGHRISDRSATHDFLLVIHNHSTDFQTKFGVKVARGQRKRSIEFEEYPDHVTSRLKQGYGYGLVVGKIYLAKLGMLYSALV